MIEKIPDFLVTFAGSFCGVSAGFVIAVIFTATLAAYLDRRKKAKEEAIDELRGMIFGNNGSEPD